MARRPLYEPHCGQPSGRRCSARSRLLQPMAILALKPLPQPDRSSCPPGSSLASGTGRRPGANLRPAPLPRARPGLAAQLPGRSSVGIALVGLIVLAVGLADAQGVFGLLGRLAGCAAAPGRLGVRGARPSWSFGPGWCRPRYTTSGSSGPTLIAPPRSARRDSASCRVSRLARRTRRRANPGRFARFL